MGRKCRTQLKSKQSYPLISVVSDKKMGSKKMGLKFLEVKTLRKKNLSTLGCQYILFRTLLPQYEHGFLEKDVNPNQNVCFFRILKLFKVGLSFEKDLFRKIVKFFYLN